MQTERACEESESGGEGTEGYLVGGERITGTMRDASVIGTGQETMKSVRVVGNGLGRKEGVGSSGKDGQRGPGGVRQTSLLIEGITVGGTQA